jgi:hypothetical protein
MLIPTIEIGDISTYRMLSPELQTLEVFRPKVLPQKFFCMGWCLTKLSAKFENITRC